MADAQPPLYIPIRTRRPVDTNSLSSTDSTYGSGASETHAPSATHDISRVSYHVKHLESFVNTLQESASRAFPNRGRSSQRYSKVQALLLHWKSDDLFVLPELEDLEKCLREEFRFETDVFAIPSDNPHLELMMKIAAMVKQHESEDTLFVLYYGGHAKIDESRQSTWCATRHSSSPWLQWSAIQTLLERSKSDTLILLDCCAGAASATFPSGQSITETISASSWDAIAPDPGRYSFTNALIEVLVEWRHRTFSAAMLHAEMLARLKHPRPILINGRHFEARSTPVHFMMTSNHKAPSIEFSRVIPEVQRLPTPPLDPAGPRLGRPSLPSPPGSPGPPGLLEAQFPEPVEEVVKVNEPNEDKPHVMISLALEEDQHLDLNAWEQWLAGFPALARHVTVQGIFRSHSTLLLLSLPVMVWDLLPDDPACSFVAFIRSNNLLVPKKPVLEETAVAGGVPLEAQLDGDIGDDAQSIISGTTFLPYDDATTISQRPELRWGPPPPVAVHMRPTAVADGLGVMTNVISPAQGEANMIPLPIPIPTPILPRTLSLTHPSTPSPERASCGEQISIGRTMIHTQIRSSRRKAFSPAQEVPESPRLAKHVVQRLEDYFQRQQFPLASVTDFLASNLGIQTHDVDVWFHYRREQERMNNNLQNLKINDLAPETSDGARMILPGDLQQLLDIFPTKKVLVVDLRAPSQFEKSHIHEAINLRVPLSFVQDTSLEMIEDTFTDDQSRRTFGKWPQARCVVFYDRVVEFNWECPIADALHDKFRRIGWTGQCFILKGHYPEFSTSFEKYISGTKMSQEAKDYLDSLRQQPVPTSADANKTEERYQEWLRQREYEDRLPTGLIPSKKAERVRALDEHQRELEAELEMRVPALYKKALSLRPTPSSYTAAQPERPWSGKAYGEDKWKDRDNFDIKAPLVEPLSRGLAKMQEAGVGPPRQDYKGDYKGGFTSAGHLPGEVNKLGDPWPSDEYDDFENDESLRADPAFQKAGAKVAAQDGVGDESSRKGRGSQSTSFWKRLRPSAR